MSRHLKVLLIEDDEDDFIIIKNSLRDISSSEFELYRAETYESGVEAICRAEFDAVLLDYRLGERNGLELLREAASNGCLAPIILLTGQGDYKVDIEAMNAGAADYLIKGQISSDLLERSIRYSISRKRAELELRSYRNHLEELVKERTEQLESVNEELRVSHRLLEIAHEQTEITPLLSNFVSEIKKYTGCDAVGIRVLDEEGNIPYQAYEGFSQKFYELESPFSIKSDQCMCINVIRDDFDAGLPFYREGGSFVVNATSRFLASVSEEEKGRKRNVCNLEGYESVALFPFRKGDWINGLIHVADHREDMVPPHVVEVLEKAALQLGAAFERIHAKDKLRESGEHFRAMFESSSVGMTQANLQTGRFERVNERFCSISGYTAKELLGMSFSDITHPEDRQWGWEAFQRLVRGETPEYRNEKRYVRKDGAIVWVNVNVTLLKDNDGRPLLSQAVIEDITERRMAEDALRENQRVLSTLLSNLYGMAYRCRNDRHWTMEFVSNGCLALTGYEPEDLIDNARLSYNDLIHPEDREPVWEDVQAALGVREPFQLFYRIIAADGKVKWVWEQGRGVLDKDGAFIAFEGFITDITERKLAEEERVRLATAIEQAAEAIFISDPDWIIQYVNPAFEHLTGYSNTEIMGRHTRILRSYQHDEAFYGNMRDTLARGEVWSGRIVNKKKSDAFYDAVVTVSPVKDNTGAIINYVSIHRDITREVRLERQLQQAQKMEAIGTLAGGIAHDFNNILGIMIGYTELALLKGSEIPGLHRYLTQMKQTGLRAAELVKQILTFSRQNEQERKAIEIAPAVEEVLKLLRSSLPANIEIHHEIKISPQKGTILSNTTEIHQVVMNLCTNAAHAMRANGGVLDIRLGEAAGDADLLLQHPDRKEWSYVCLTVSDTGQGMDDRVVDRIFDPFFTTKGPGEGTGLGLSVVAGIVKSLGGQITVSSEPGRGTSFKVFFPVHKEEIVPEVQAAGGLPTGTD